MRKIIPSLFFVFLTNLFPVRGQIIYEMVDFNYYVSPTDNDYFNRFNSGLGFSQITTNGITGGCLVVPATMNWGNDNALYCSKYVGDSGSYCKTYISFKYDTTVFNQSGFDRAVSIFLRPAADFNHYIIASVTHNHRLEVLTYSWTNSPGPLLNLVHNHWYQFILRVPFTGGASGDQVDINAAVLDIGVTGLDPPANIGLALGTINDSVLFGDTAIQVSFTATGNGGAKYLDDFQFEGIKSADSCISIPTIVPEKLTENFSAFVLGNELIIQNASQGSNRVTEVYSMNGQLVYAQQILNQRTTVDISGWVSGIYVVNMRTPNSSLVRKIAIFR